MIVPTTRNMTDKSGGSLLCHGLVGTLVTAIRSRQGRPLPSGGIGLARIGVGLNVYLTTPRHTTSAVRIVPRVSGDRLGFSLSTDR
jgi:hypothetical protein